LKKYENHIYKKLKDEIDNKFWWNYPIFYYSKKADDIAANFEWIAWIWFNIKKPICIVFFCNQGLKVKYS